jgi:DNA-binding CsgD family transcriptional regulator
MAASQHSGGPDLPRELPLVGRRQDLELLFRMFGRESSTPPMFLIAGYAGVGKSRLAEALGQEAARREWVVARGRAYPVEAGMPYSVLSDAFMPILKSFDEAALTVLTRGTSADLHRLFLGPGPVESPVDDFDPAESRTRLFWSFTEFVKRLAERAPLLIVTEDLHWADPSSLSLLHFMARQLQGEPVRILATWSSGYVREPEALGRLEQSLSSIGMLVRHDLGALDRDAVEELVQAVFHVSGLPLREFAKGLYDWTHGNPYFLEETLKTLVATGRIYDRDGTWLGWEVRHLELPGSVRDSLLLRLGALSEGARSIADLVAVCGGRAPMRLLESVGDLEPATILDAVEELTAHAVAVEHEEGLDVTLELRHPMVRETLYRHLGASRRRLLHRRLAEGLEELHRKGTARVDQLAYHFARGGSSGVDVRAARYLTQAGRSALGRHADLEGVAYLEAALQRYPDVDAEEEPPDPDLLPRRQVEAELGRGLARVGRYGDAAILWDRLRAEASQERNAQASAEALRHLGLLAYWGGRHEAALESYDQALAELRDHGPQALEARILLASGVALQELGRPDDARNRIETSLSLAHALEDPTLLGRGHRALALLYTWIGQADDARRHGWQAVEIADRAGDPYVRFWGRWALASLEGLRGHTEEMSRLMGQAGQVADELRSPVLRLWTAELEVEYLIAVGDWDSALTQGERAIALATSLHQRSLLPRLLVWTSTVYIGRGDLERARELVDRAWALAGLGEESAGRGDVHVSVPAHIGRAAILLAEERYDDAIRVGRAGLALADAVGYTFWSLHRLLPIVGEALIRSRDLDGARDVGRRLRADGERLGHRLAAAWADACDALVLWVSGEETEKSVSLLQGAWRTLDAIPLRYDAARVRRQVAGRLAELGRRDEALAELEAVHEVFLQLGAEPELQKTRNMYRELDARPPRPVPPVPRGIEELTGREFEIADLVAQRRSNKAIAKELGIAHRTVTTHTQNIYRKLGINTRGELVDIVREARLTGAGGVGS